ncbi:uncharacterized protein LOC101098541 [Felis catus]|uniref:uncharacterized protein LOC101098541 n=1 Tax=Felis catus TaxID=9685 RepID=UPI001D19C062|nr:uncharacterized protein LOC101098541 [Felis catus]
MKEKCYPFPMQISSALGQQGREVPSKTGKDICQWKPKYRHRCASHQKLEPRTEGSYSVDFVLLKKQARSASPPLRAESRREPRTGPQGPVAGAAARPPPGGPPGGLRPHSHRTIAAAPLPPPYTHPVTRIPTRRPRVYVSIHRRNVTRYPAHSIVVVGRPSLQSRVWEDFFTFLGIFLGIILFPFGFICYSASRKQRYPKGGANLTLKGTIHLTFLHPDIFS